MNSFGESIDLSTCVSAAKLKIAFGLYFFKMLKTFFLLFMSNLKEIKFFLLISLRT